MPHPLYRPLILTAVAALVLAGLAPNAAARIQCDSTEVFLAGPEPYEGHFSCDLFFDAVLVTATNGAAGPTKAGFTLCLEAADGTIFGCKEGCGHQAIRRLAGDVDVIVRMSITELACPAVAGTLLVAFADE